MRVFLSSIGCRLNQSEVETMARQLVAAGHEIVADAAQADKVILNTCAVTRQATRDARSQARRIHRQNRGAEIWLTGCYATIAPQEVARLPGAGKVVANADKERLVQMLGPRTGGEMPAFEQEPLLRPLPTGGPRATSFSRTRAFVKVQDGCDNRCTFCITTVARGAGRSRPLGEVVAEIQALAAAGYQEAVLTGVHLGSYGQDLGQAAGLRQLVQAILADSDIPRLRLSSLEPWDIEPGFFRLWQNRRLLPHLHLPLQSGSDTVLRRMARRTRQADFRCLAEAARSHIADLNLSTDIIAGFPGETEAEFAQSLDFVQEMGFSRLHVFRYSRRPGTAAASMAGQVAATVKKARARRMIALGKELALAFQRRFEGRVLPVLWEMAVGADDAGIRWLGYTDNYIRVSAHGPAELFNRVTPVRLRAASADGMEGEIIA